MSYDTTLRSASDVYASSQTAGHNVLKESLAATINNAAACGQTCVIFSTKLTDDIMKELEDNGYTVTVSGVNTIYAPQYIISWKPQEKKESEGI